MTDHLTSEEAFKRIEKKIETRKGRQRWPYYKEDIALGVKKLLDKLHETRQPQRITPSLGKVSTVKAQYYQGVQYLIDYIDSNYKKIYLATRLYCFDSEGYLELHLKYNLLEATEAPITDWRESFLEFLEKANPGEKYNKNIALSTEDIAWVQSILEPLGQAFLSKLTNTEILIIKDKI